MNVHLNLLPWHLQCRTLLVQRLRQWSIAWAILVAFSLLLVGERWNKLSEAGGELQAWERRADGILSIELASQKLRDKVARQQERLAKFGHLQNEDLGFQLLATVSQSAALTTGGVQVRRMSFKTNQVALPAAAGAAADAPVKTREARVLALSGKAKSNLAVAQFVSSLRDASVFDSVDLKSTQDDKELESSFRMFLVECSF